MTSSMLMFRRFDSLFQSASPEWGMTEIIVFSSYLETISIRIPRVGDDISW